MGLTDRMTITVIVAAYALNPVGAAGFVANSPQDPPTTQEEMRLIAGLELNTLLFVGAADERELEGAMVSMEGTPIYDLNGTLLLRRFTIDRDGLPIGFVDMAASHVMNGLFLGFTPNHSWMPDSIKSECRREVEDLFTEVTPDSLRFVAFAYPHIGIQAFSTGHEILLMDLNSWTRIPEYPAQEVDPNHQCLDRRSYFEDPHIPRAWSPEEYRGHVEKRMEILNALEQYNRDDRIYNISLPAMETMLRFSWRTIRLFGTHHMVRYRLDIPLHEPCFEIRGQKEWNWCRVASLQMILDYYRYNYSQQTIKDVLCREPYGSQGLEWSVVGDQAMIDACGTLSLGSLTATPLDGASFEECKTEIDFNRAFMSQYDTHVYVVAGYTHAHYEVFIPDEPFIPASEQWEPYPWRRFILYDPRAENYSNGDDAPDDWSQNPGWAMRFVEDSYVCIDPPDPDWPKFFIRLITY